MSVLPKARKLLISPVINFHSIELSLIYNFTTDGLNTLSFFGTRVLSPQAITYFVMCAFRILNLSILESRKARNLTDDRYWPLNILEHAWRFDMEQKHETTWLSQQQRFGNNGRPAGLPVLGSKTDPHAVARIAFKHPAQNCKGLVAQSKRMICWNCGSKASVLGLYWNNSNQGPQLATAKK